MELKSYQQKVIADLTRYLELLTQTRNYPASFRYFWDEKGASSLGWYQDITPGVPNLCFKVPTGGGKTFLACNAIKPIFDALPFTKTKVVVWLVPSDAILTQTLKALKDSSHPYRQKLDSLFSGKVEVYSKQELLCGQNFNPVIVTEQLSIMVLSYDSFRGRGKEGLKAYQENSALFGFAKTLGAPEVKIENAEDSALFQIINQLNPLVIVDESHHARSELSLEMLRNFNPCFVLDLTATPRKESNIISYVDAIQLKTEHMVKLPVIVYNRNCTNEVIADAIDLRNKLEELAQISPIGGNLEGAAPIRPIVLFQAQPKGKENASTFEKLKAQLIQIGIPSEQIAIRTADINELKTIDLLSRSCPIRYIITVNALKEGWDCPFAYILASLANRTSQVEVEQILGRVLRLPYTQEHPQPSLNMSYVLTSSANFEDTVQRIVKGLNQAGFSEKDYKWSQAIPEMPQLTAAYQPKQLSLSDVPKKSSDDICDVNPNVVSSALKERQSNHDMSKAVQFMLTDALQISNDYQKHIEAVRQDPITQSLPFEIRDKVTSFEVKPEFRQQIESIQIPQFYLVVPRSLFYTGTQILLEKEQLAKNFKLQDKSTDITFENIEEQIAKIDIENKGNGLPMVYKLSNSDQKYFKQYFNSLPPKGKINFCRDLIYNQLNRLNMVESGQLYQYVNRVIENMDNSQLSNLEKYPQNYAYRIREKIEYYLNQHYKKTFKQWIETERVVCKPGYRLPLSIHPAKTTASIKHALYEQEESMNQLELKLVTELDKLSNIQWIHRNIAKQGFFINGFINHYPDLIVHTQSNRFIMIETKGDHLKNDDTRDKLELGDAWRTAAGKQFRYYMVFDNDEDLLPGSVSMNQFIEIIKEL